METPKNKPWNFCETPKEKCTMNYCDDNGCQNRKRNLVEPKKSKAATFILGQIDKAIEKSNLEQQIEKTETIYRKVQFEINCKDHDKTWLIGKSANFIFNPNTRSGEELSDFLAGCEEIPDPTAQLQSDKAELLEALDNSRKVIEWYMENTMPENENNTDFFNIGMNQRSEIESLIQKHKQCQENTPR